MSRPDVVGHLALWGALVGALGAVLLSVRRRGGVWALAAAVAALAVATGTLAKALVDNEFGLTYVADFSRRQASTPYRLAALWGGMAGSLLFFATVAGLVGLLAAWRLRGRAAQDVVVGVVGTLVAALAGLVLALADPFERLDLPPVDGGGLPPILEHPAMLYHPPLLYLGLATLAAPFALVVAGLLGHGRDVDLDLSGTVRRWLMMPWTLLAVGMVAGAHWAYVELGWGGYWAWDPVENTALLPWLAVTLALHAGLRDHRGGGGRGQAAFVCLAFLLALTGTMLTRSGAVPSVHAFAEDRSIGRALAVLVGLTTAAVVLLFVRNRPDTAAGTPRQGLVGWLLLGQLAIVGTVLAITFVGTVAPLYSDLTGGDDVAIEGRYFASFAGPLAAAGLALVALAPTALRARSLSPDDLVPPGVGAILAVGVLTAAGGHVRLPQLVLAAAAGAALASGVVALGRRTGRAGPHVAHAGLGLLLLGIAGTATGRTEIVSLQPGDTAEVLGQRVEYLGVYVDDGQSDGTSAVVADLRIDGRARRPALVAYPDLLRVQPETSLVSTPWRDVQVALADAADDGTAVLRIGVHPLQAWVWWGALTIVTGGLVTAWGHRRRRRDPRREPETVAVGSS